MTDTKQESLVRQPGRAFDLMPSSLGEAMELAKIIASSDFAPKDYVGKPHNVMLAVQMGADLGLKPMQALQNIAVINGRPSIWGDAALALAMPVLESFKETFEGTFPEDGFTAICVSKREGWPDETRSTFSIGDAKKADLWTKKGPWSTYPKRMLQLRARGFNLRDVASDRLMGLVLAEEAGDYGPSIDGSVVSSEVVTPPVLSVFERVPEGLRNTIGRAFAELHLSSTAEGVVTLTGAGLAKMNEFLAGDGVDPEAGATKLIDWCKDEYARRKTGQPRKAKDGNGKEKKDDKTTDIPATASKAADDLDVAANKAVAETPAQTVPAVVADTPAVAVTEAKPPTEDALF